LGRQPGGQLAQQLNADNGDGESDAVGDGQSGTHQLFRSILRVQGGKLRRIPDHHYSPENQKQQHHRQGRKENQRRQRLASAPPMEQTKKTILGENLSANVKKANNNVPPIKPNCTEEMMEPTAPEPNSNFSCNGPRMALPENQREVPINWEATITGRICLGRSIIIFLIELYSAHSNWKDRM